MTSCTMQSGRSLIIALSVFIRRSMKGATSFLKASAARGSCSFSIGTEKFSRKSDAVPRSPGCTIEKIDQYSIRRFSTGVPVIAITRSAGKEEAAA